MIVCLSPLTDASFPNTPCGALRRRFFAGRRGGVNSALSVLPGFLCVGGANKARGGVAAGANCKRATPASPPRVLSLLLARRKKHARPPLLRPRRRRRA